MDKGNKRYKFKGLTFKFLDTKTLAPNIANVKSVDIWKRSFTPQQLKENDTLAICDVGAYGIVLASNYNLRPKPAEVLINNSSIKIISKRENINKII